jgi:hypothetical protein
MHCSDKEYKPLEQYVLGYKPRSIRRSWFDGRDYHTNSQSKSTIAYVATDQSGLTPTNTRTVIIQELPPSSQRMLCPQPQRRARNKKPATDILCVSMPPSPAPTPNPAEVARREQELREAEALIANLKQRGLLGDTSSEGGISGWLIRNKIVAEESQANTAMVGVVVVAATLAGIIFLFWDNNSPGKSTLTPQQVQQLEQEPPVAPPTATPAQPVSSSPIP